MAGGGTDSQGEEGLPGHWPRGWDLEGSGGYFKSPAHSLHHLPRLPPWVPGRSRDRYRHLAALREEVLYVIFLDLHKAYDALDRSRCLDILEGYGVGPRDRILLQTYWRNLW